MTEVTMKRAHADNPFASVIEVLGESRARIRTPIELHDWIIKGLPRHTAVHMVTHLHDLKLDETMKALSISMRTWQRIKSDKSAMNEPLDADQSARVWNMAEILAKAEQVLGTREEAEQWLSRPALGLDSRRPIDLMASHQGAGLVKTLLEQMEYGVYA